MRQTCILLTLLILAAGLASCKKSRRARKPTGSFDEELKKVQPVYDALAVIKKNFPAMAGLERKKCESPPRSMGTISWDALLKVTGGQRSAVEREVATITSVANVGRVQRLPPRGKKPKYPSASRLREAREEFGRRSHLAVLRLEAAKAAQATGQATFSAGHLSGWLVVFDVKTLGPVCQWPVAVKSSQKVHFRVKRGAGTQSKEGARSMAIKRDLKRKLRTTLFQARKQLTGK